MCRLRSGLSWNGAAVTCLALLLTALLVAHGIDRASSNTTKSGLIKVRCGENTALQLPLDGGRVRISIEDVTRMNCSVESSYRQVTVTCPADSSPPSIRQTINVPPPTDLHQQSH